MQPKAFAAGPLAAVRRMRMWLHACAFLAIAAVPAQAQIRVDITKGVSDPVPIAIVPFAPAAPADGGLDVAAIVQRDLEGSGRFRPMDRKDMVSRPVRASEVQANDWRMQRTDYVVVGRLVSSGNEIVVEFELVNALNGLTLLTQRVSVAQTNLRYGAHRVSDLVFEKITGIRGAFATRIAYVSVDGAAPNQRFQLVVADADGENVRRIMEDSRPIMSPAWSPDGEWIAYVSFEKRLSSIVVQRVRTGERRTVSARAGVNNAPAWSPDGKKLALTLSGSSGNLDVYVLDLGTQQLTRLTDDASIDTEPTWSPDGNLIYFTSDRAGNPQIYSVAPRAGERAKRITFGSSYNARPRISPDGKHLATVAQEGGGFRIAVQDIESGTQRVLSRGSQDESPSFAPNGAILIYGGKERGQGVLATVSVDGQITQRLKADAGEVREPVWGPFTN